MAHLRESWRFSIQLNDIHVAVPPPASGGAEHAVYIKWRRGKERGKVPSVAVSKDTAKITNDGRLLVQLQDEMVEFVCGFNRDAVDPELLQPKTIDFEVLLLTLRKGDETDRRCLYSSSFDLRRLLDGARVNEMRAHSFMLCATKHHVMRVTYAVSNPSATPPTFQRSRARSASPADEEMVSMSLRGDHNFRSAVPMIRCSASDEIPAVAQALEAARLSNAHLRGDALTSLAKMLQDGETRRVHVADMPLDVAFDVLFNDSAPFVTFMHEARRNRHFCDQPWRVEGRHTWKRVQYQGRFGEEYKKCIETAMLVAAEDEGGNTAYYKLSIVDVPELPVNARLQLLVSCRPEGAGVTVLFAGYAHIANAMARATFGAKAAKHLTKILASSEEALHTLAKAPNPSQASPAPAGEAPGMVVDANLWSRLGDDVAVNAAVAEYYLKTLLRSPNPRGYDVKKAWQIRLRSLDQVLHRFARDEAVVDLTLQHLQRVVAAVGVEAFATANSDLVTASEECTRQCPTLRTKWAPFVASLHRAAADAARRRRDAIVNAENPLEPLADTAVLADAELVKLCLETALRRFTPMRSFSFEEVSLLTRVMGLHIDVVAVTHFGLKIVDMLSDKAPFRTHAGFVLLLENVLRLRPTMGTRFRHTMEAVREAADTSDFARRYGTFIQESPTFEASVWLMDAGVGATAYVTDTFVCIAGDVIERDRITSVEQFRVAFVKPAVAFTIAEEGGERTVRLSTWSRGGLLDALASRTIASSS